MEFAMRYSPFMRVLLTLMLAGPRRTRIHVDDRGLDLRMGAGGWCYATRVPRSSVRSVESRTDPLRLWGWGAHGWRGRWLVNGSMRGLVEIAIDPPARARCLGWPIRLRTLIVSVEEPAAFVEALGQ
jgi:hypothetical protein